MMKKYSLAACTLLALLAGVWLTLPWWLPRLAGIWLPAGAALTVKSLPGWHHGVAGAGFGIGIRDCTLLDVDDVTLARADGRWRLNIARLTLDSDCFSLLPQDDAAAAFSLAQWQKRLPSAEVTIGRLAVLPWDAYAGQARLVLDARRQSLSYRAPPLALDADLQGWRFTLRRGEIAMPGASSRLALSGESELAADMTPAQGTLNGQIAGDPLPEPLSVTLQWQGAQGRLSVNAPKEDAALVSLPWRFGAESIQIDGGDWRWPYAAQPLSGQLSATLRNWRQGLDSTGIEARINMLTQGHNGKANAVLTLGPGNLGLVDSALRFQLTGQANLSAVSFSASLPGMIRGSILNPEMALLPGALLRAWGSLAPQLQLKEARWPLAGIRVSAGGVNGRLQAIVHAYDRYWGRVALHLDGDAQDFWPDKGLWRWRYWGNGQLPPLAARWDVAGRGNWQGTLVSVERLSSGLDQLRYGRVSALQPRLTLTEPLRWQRSGADQQFHGALQLEAQRVDLGDGGYLPPARLACTLAGRAPDDFQWQGQLRAQAIGPVELRGRWDGTRLRGMGWWPPQPLTVFQPLLPPRLKIALRSGQIYAQTAFSAAPEQGFSAGGHWVVKNGGAWLQDGDVSGVDFVLPYRLQQHRWQLGVKAPATLRIAQVNNVFAMTDIRLDLQGFYPYSERWPLVLSQAEMHALRGRIGLSALRWPLRDTAWFTLDGIELSELFTALKVKPFAMSGRVSGGLPLNFADPATLIARGRMANDSFLTLRLDPQLADDLARKNMASGAATDWLRYLEIASARATLNMSTTGELSLYAHIRGQNPQRSRQRQVVLNYRHQENLFQLWRSLRFGGNVQDALEQQANE